MIESRGRIRRVFFDVGGTLLRVEPSVGEVYARAAADHGFEVDPAHLDRRFRAAWRSSQARAAARGHACSDAILREEWRLIVGETFAGTVGDEALVRIFADLYERFVSPAAWRIAPGVLETLAHLRERRLSLGVLSNWDRRLVQTLRELDLEPYFDLQVISHEVGFEKPHRAIFETAVRRSREEPARILHIGDSLDADIRPARSLGLETLWIASAADRKTAGASGPGAASFADLGPRDWDRLLD